MQAQKENIENENILQKIKAIAVDAPSSHKPFIFIKTNKTYRKVSYSEILYIKASGSYCEILLSDQSFMVSISLNNVLDQLDTNDIIRCHRSFAVNVDTISAFDETTIELESEDSKVTLPVSMTYRARLMKMLPRLRCC